MTLVSAIEVYGNAFSLTIRQCTGVHFEWNLSSYKLGKIKVIVKQENPYREPHWSKSNLDMRQSRVSANSFKGLCVKCFAVHSLEFEMLQTTKFGEKKIISDIL